MYATFRYNFQSIRRREELKNRGLFLEGWKRRRRRGGGKGEAGGWLQKNGVELSISPEETSSHFSIVPFPSRVRQGLKSACYSVPPPPSLPILNGCFDTSVSIGRRVFLNFSFKTLENLWRRKREEEEKEETLFLIPRDDKLDPRKPLSSLLLLLSLSYLAEKKEMIGTQRWFADRRNETEM